MKIKLILVLIFGLFISNVSSKKCSSMTPPEISSANRSESIKNNTQPFYIKRTQSKQSTIDKDCDDEKSNVTLSSNLRKHHGGKKFWPNGIVPYVISIEYTTRGQMALIAAMDKFHQKTCIRFIPRTSQRSYIKFEADEKCETDYGMQDGEQKIIVGVLCFEKPGWVESLLMNTLGFHSDHMMPIRDKYVEILYRNIPHHSRHLYRKMTDGEWATLQVYDYRSLIHVPNTAFRGYKGVPFRTKDPKYNKIFGGPRLTNMDVIKINMMYKCPCEAYSKFDINNNYRS